MKPLYKFALAYLVFTIILTLVIKYLLPVELAFSGKMLFVQAIVVVLALVILGRKFFRNSDYVLTYGDALKNIFLGGLMAMAISVPFSTLLYNNDAVTHEKFAQMQIDNNVGAAAWGMSVGGMSDDEVELKKAEMRDQYESGEISIPDFPFTWAALPITLLSGIVGHLIYSLIAGIFVKQRATA